MISAPPRPLNIIPRFLTEFQPKRLPRRKAVSIAIAAICKDGLVMCADTQVTHPNGDKSYECKISTIQLSENRGTLVLSYAGIPDDEKAVVERLRNKIAGQDKTFDDVRTDLQDALNKVLGRSRRNHQMLCGYCDSGNFRLLKTSDRVISPVDCWDCVGWGDSALTKYLGAIFLSGDILPLLRAVPICIYLIAQAKKYVGWCGGDTDIAVLNPNGEVTELPLGTKYDAACAMVERWLNGILTSATEPSVTAESINELIMALRNVMNQQIGDITAFLRTSDCVGCGKKSVSTEPAAKFCSICKRWVCSSCVIEHGKTHIADKATGSFQ